MEYKQVYIPRTCKQKCNYMSFPYMLVVTKKRRRMLHALLLKLKKYSMFVFYEMSPKNFLIFLSKYSAEILYYFILTFI